METNLRPMTLGEILDRTAQLYRTNFLLFAGIASVYAGSLLVVGLIQASLTVWMQVHNMVRQLVWMAGLFTLVTIVLIFVLGGIAVAANNRAVAWLHLGEPATIRGAYRSILPDFWRYIWLGILKVLFAWLPPIIVYGGFLGMLFFVGLKQIAAGAGPTGQPPQPAPGQLVALGIAAIVFVVLMFPALIYGILMSLRYAIAVPACVVENLKARAAIKRSIELTKGSRGRIFVLWLLVGIIAIALSLVSQSFFVIMAFKHHQQLALGWRILQQLVGFLTNTFVAPILATGLTLFYYDQRVRKEGYDIEWMMQAAGMTALPAAPAQAASAVIAMEVGVPVAPAPGETAAQPAAEGEAAEPAREPDSANE